jgi:carboxymethylenebutenolidase
MTGPTPGVLVITDALGLRPTIEEMADRIAADGAAYLDSLQRVASPRPVAITGYCMGGGLGWQIAAAHPDRVAALACFHPGLPVTDAPDGPHRSAAKLTAERYLGFADQDPSMTAEQIATLERPSGRPGCATAPREQRRRRRNSRCRS